MSVVIHRPPGEVLDFCLRSEGFVAMMPDRITVLQASTETGELGGTYVFRWWFKRVIPVRWAAFIDGYEPGRAFSDIQLRGIFRYFHHTHTCEPTDGGTRYTDTVLFVGPWGRWIDRNVLLPQLEATFRERHRRMRQLLEASGA
jgi:ligand-binding SRPBCC domain-containing protein